MDKQYHESDDVRRVIISMNAIIPLAVACCVSVVSTNSSANNCNLLTGLVQDSERGYLSARGELKPSLFDDEKLYYSRIQLDSLSDCGVSLEKHDDGDRDYDFNCLWEGQIAKQKFVEYDKLVASCFPMIKPSVNKPTERRPHRWSNTYEIDEQDFGSYSTGKEIRISYSKSKRTDRFVTWFVITWWKFND